MDDVVPFDLVRMFVGEAPPLFYAEIVVRTVIIYGYTLLLLRWIGGRSVGQLSVIEFLLVIALGSAVGDSPFYPEVPLLHAMAAITIVVLFNKLLDNAMARSERLQLVVDGRPTTLIEAGRMLTDRVGALNMGPAEIKEAMRIAGIRNFGEVEYAYLEASGKISLFRYDTPRPGLQIVPPDLVHPRETLTRPRDEADLCCANCGYVTSGAALGADERCDNCGKAHWTRPRRADDRADGKD